MKADAWMPLYIADYRKKTARLTCEQHGAYLLLIMDYWVGGPLPDDDVALAQVTGLGLKEWRKVRPAIEKFFVVIDGEWRHSRIEEERERAQRLSASRREAGSKGGRPRKQNESEQKPIGFANANQTALQTETPACVARPSPSPSHVPSELDADEGASAPEDWPKANPMAVLVEEIASPWLDPAKSPTLITTAGQVMAWKRAGASWEHDVLPVVRGVCAKRRAAIASWKFFDAEIARSIADNRRALELPEARPLSTGPPSLADRLAAENAEARKRAFALLGTTDGQPN